MYNSEVKNNKYNYLTGRLITGEEKVKYRNFVNPFLRYALSVAIESVPLEVSSSWTEGGCQQLSRLLLYAVCDLKSRRRQPQ